MRITSTGTDGDAGCPHGQRLRRGRQGVPALALRRRPLEGGDGPAVPAHGPAGPHPAAAAPAGRRDARDADPAGAAGRARQPVPRRLRAAAGPAGPGCGQQSRSTRWRRPSRSPSSPPAVPSRRARAGASAWPPSWVWSWASAWRWPSTASTTASGPGGGRAEHRARRRRGDPRLTKAQRGVPQVLTATSPGSGVAEAYRGLRAAVLLVPSRPVAPEGTLPPLDLSTWRPPQVLLVTSPSAADGKTSTVVNLAAAMAESGRSVVVLDADFRNPNANRYLGVPRSPGLSDLLNGAVPGGVPAVLQSTSVDGVDLITSGTSPRPPGAMLSRLGGVLEELRTLADVVIIDVAPMLLANDATDIVPHVDSVLVVTHVGRTSGPLAERTVDLLARLAVPVLGVVVQSAAEADAAGGYHAYGSLDLDGSAGTDDGEDDAAPVDDQRAPRRQAHDPNGPPGPDHRAPTARPSRRGRSMRSAPELLQRLHSRTATLCVIGQGYVGLSVAAGAAEVGMTAYGVDRDQERIAGLHAGRNVVPGVDDTLFAGAVATGRLHFGTDLAVARQADVVLICVPTPVVDHRPDMSFIEGAGRALAPHLRAGTLVVLESTTYPGTTEQVLQPLLEASGLRGRRGLPARLLPRAHRPGQPEVRPAQHARASSAGSATEATEAATAFYAPDRRRGRRAVEPARRRARQAAREHLPHGQHRPGQRAGAALRRAGHRHLGGHRGRGDQALRLHALLPGPRRRWPLHPARPDLPGLAVPARHRSPVPARGDRAGHQRPDADLRRAAGRRGAQRRGQVRARAPGPGPRRHLQARRRRRPGVGRRPRHGAAAAQGRASSASTTPSSTSSTSTASTSTGVDLDEQALRDADVVVAADAAQQPSTSTRSSSTPPLVFDARNATAARGRTHVVTL